MDKLIEIVKYLLIPIIRQLLVRMRHPEKVTFVQRIIFAM